MKLHGQRWLYRLGNAEIVVENAFSWWGWAQERWLINGDVIRETGGWFEIRRVFDEPWLTGVDCSVTLEREALDHDALFEASWRGKRSWPAFLLAANLPASPP
jgi:hypothetical protein